MDVCVGIFCRSDVRCSDWLRASATDEAPRSKHNVASGARSIPVALRPANARRVLRLGSASRALSGFDFGIQ